MDPTPEWLRPVGERYLSENAGSPPLAVRVATGFAATGALAGGGMVAIWGPMTGRALAVSPVDLFALLLAGALTLTGTGLAAVLAASAFMIIWRGWHRLPAAAGWVLGGVAALGICVAAFPARITDPDLHREWATSAAVLPWLLAAAVAGCGVPLLLRTSAAGDWLATRRHQRRAGRG